MCIISDAYGEILNNLMESVFDGFALNNTGFRFRAQNISDWFSDFSCSTFFVVFFKVCYFFLFCVHAVFSARSLVA